MEQLLHIAGNICLGLGSFFLLTTAVGLWRMPDFFTRLHPAGVSDSVGAPLILVGIALLSPIGLVTVKISLLMIFALYTGATACHALAKAALVDGQKPVAKIKPKTQPKKRRVRKK